LCKNKIPLKKGDYLLVTPFYFNFISDANDFILNINFFKDCKGVIFAIFTILMPSEKHKKRSLSQRLRDRYRLVIFNDSSLQEKLVLKLKPLTLFIGIGAIIIFLIIIVISIIAFTPLREYIPGYSDVTVRRSLINLAVKTDSLEYELDLKTKYINNINNVISGNIKVDSLYSNYDSTKNYQSLLINTKPSKMDSVLRREVEQKERFSLAQNNEIAMNTGVSSFFFFTPLKGIVTVSYKISDEHFGVDVVAKENEAIKATLDGTVIMAAWTIESGYTVQIQHNNNLVSVYKHCSILMIKAGRFVKAGDVIAIVGNSGEQTTGPHLHFELWYNGHSIDPQDYMVF